MTDERLEELIDTTGGFWVEDEFRINGKELMTLLRAAAAGDFTVVAWTNQQEIEYVKNGGIGDMWKQLDYEDDKPVALYALSESLK